ncbi:hypothetical protein LSAT2_032262 [Lamellibrachia satsuma]|nr:hypothetical protein LSAT2_032262 [Lamellibrachia satsuma]
MSYKNETLTKLDQHVNEMMATAVGAALVVAPQYILDFQVDGTLSSTHLLVARILGISILTSGVMFWATRETWDGTVPITLLMSRVFSCSLVLLAQVCVHWGTSKGKKNINWNDTHIMFGMTCNVLWLTLSLVHVLRSSDFSTYPQHNVRINTLLHVDSWFICLLSALFLAFPDVILSVLVPSVKSPNVVHLHLTRMIGIHGIGSAIISLQAPGFLHESDKRVQFISRIACQLLLLTFMASLVYLERLTTNQAAKVSVVLIPSLFNAVLGFSAGGTANYPAKKYR